MDIKDQPWANFAENLSRELIEHPPTEALFISRSTEEDRVSTGYYNCTFESRCTLLGHLLTDIVLEIIEVNPGMVRQILRNIEEAEDEEDEE